EQLETFLARQRAREHPAPRFIEWEFRDYLTCGVTEHGFLRLRCSDCHHDRVLAFSCKKRGVCPSCDGRRMSGTANRTSAIDGRTVRQPGYPVSQKKRKRVEEIFGWLKTVRLMRQTRHRGKERVG